MGAAKNKGKQVHKAQGDATGDREKKKTMTASNREKKINNNFQKNDHRTMVEEAMEGPSNTQP